LLAVVPACYQPADVEPCVLTCTGGGECPGDLACNDGFCGPPGACVPDAPTEFCAGASNGLLPSVCFPELPPPAVVTGPIFDTDTGPCTEVAGHPELCFVVGSSVTVVGNVSVRGNRPLVLWSATTIEVPADAKLDVGSHTVNVRGAGSNDTKCAAVDGRTDATLSTPDNPRIGSGGCGGSFGALGGVGGAGSGGNGVRTISSDCVPVTQVVDRVRGGCRGGHGGLSDGVGTLNGGASGGAVYLMSTTAIFVSGLINANGSTGRLANSNNSTMAAGGGGGSGGLIGLDAPSITITGILVAVGGSGSSGTGKVAAGDPPFQGNTGHDPKDDPPAFAQGALQTVDSNSGGGGNIEGEAGGDVKTTVFGGGGGGAGGVGYINAYSTQVEATTATTLPAIVQID
jgi:hypothetical protein